MKLSICLLLQLWISLSTQDGCDKEKCQGPFRIEDPEPIKQSINLTELEFYCEKAPKTAEVWTGYRKFYTKLFVNPMFGDEEVYESITDMRPDNEELKDWSRRGECSYGRECHKGNKECTATHIPSGFCGDKSMRNWAKTSKEWSEVGVYWKEWAADTCIQSWACGIHRSEVPLSFNENGDLVTYQSGWKEIKLRYNEENFYDYDSMTKIGIIVGGPVKKRLTFQCVKMSANVLCQMSDDFWLENSMNAAVELKGDMITLKNIKCQRVQGISHGEVFGHTIASNRTDGINPEIKVLIDAILYTQMQQSYNSLKILKETNTLATLVNRIISSLSKLDDELVGRLFDVRTKSLWFNENVFYNCPCYQTDIPIGQNCHKKHGFFNGRTIKIQGEEEAGCTKIKESDIKGIKPFSHQAYQFERLEVPPPDPDPSAWEGWSWISSEKDKMEDMNVFLDHSGNKEESLGWINGMDLSSIKAAAGFFGLSGIATWALLAVVVVLLRR